MKNNVFSLLAVVVFMVSSVNLGAANYFFNDCVDLAVSVHDDMREKGFSQATAAAAADSAYVKCEAAKLKKCD